MLHTDCTDKRCDLTRQKSKFGCLRFNWVSSHLWKQNTAVTTDVIYAKLSAFTAKKKKKKEAI